MRTLSKSLILLILVVPFTMACRGAKSATSEQQICEASLSMERHVSQILAKDSVYVEHFRDSIKMDSLVYVIKTEVEHHFHRIYVQDSSAIRHDTLYVEKAEKEVVKKPSILDIWREAVPLSLTLSIILTLFMILVLLRKK